MGRVMVSVGVSKLLESKYNPTLILNLPGT